MGGGRASRVPSRALGRKPKGSVGRREPHPGPHFLGSDLPWSCALVLEGGSPAQILSPHPTPPAQALIAAPG